MLRLTMFFLLVFVLGASCISAATKAGTIAYDKQCFTVNGRDMYIYSGEFHYFRCPKPLWQDRLLKFKRAGFNTVDIYVPWNWHEPIEGKLDLKDLDELLTLCRKMGLMVIARPGPYICAEWDVGGFPRWLPVKQTGFRSNSDASKKWSDRWYGLVMPVIAKHQINRGGTVIMVQVENEYSFSGKPDAEMLDYTRSLYKSALKHGIEVPIITCWTHVARNENDPDMARIIDTCNFYPRWDFKFTQDSIAELHKEQPDAPLMVTELQGGWFNHFGGVGPQDHGLGASQINALTKTVLACGLTASNYYMLFGGTNFGYTGARHLTTTYDYQAPIAEPGGLWEKYYAVKLIGDFLKLYGPLLVRAVPIENGASADKDGVTVWERANGRTGFVFVRNDADEWKRCKVTYTDPGTGGKAEEPLDIMLSPRDMKVLVVNAPVPGGMIKSCNAEIQSAVKVGKKTVIAVYNDEDLDKKHKLQVNAEINGRKISYTSLPAQKDEVLFLQDDPELLVVVMDRKKAGRTWQVPCKGSDALVISDAYLLRSYKESKDGLEITLDTMPGECPISIVAPSKPEATHIGLVTPGIPFKPIVISAVRTKADPVANGAAWRKLNELASLDNLGIFENGFIRYKASFESDGVGEVFLMSHASDPKLVFVNGKLVPGACGDAAAVSAKLDRYVKKGSNQIEILYENPGRDNGGATMEELKGLRSVITFYDGSGTQTLGNWRAKRSSAPTTSPDEVKPEYDDSGWEKVTVGNGTQALMDGYEGWAWYRCAFDMPASFGGNVDSILLFEGVDDDGVIYLNGQKIGEHQGWNSPFVISGFHTHLRPGHNTLTVAVRNAQGPGGIYKPVRLFVSTEDAGRAGSWQLTQGTAGQNAGWMKPGLDDSAWTRLSLGMGDVNFRLRKSDEAVSSSLDSLTSSDAVKWYRFKFHLDKMDGWDIPLKLKILADGEGLIYLNGEHLGRYKDIGPQTEFYMPENWLKFGREENTVAVMLRPSTRAPKLHGALVLPYEEFSVKHNKLVVEL